MTTKMGFSAEYVESISPLDRMLYIKYYTKEKEEEKKRQTKTSGPTIGSPAGA